MRNEVFNWVGGAFVHNHFRIDDLIAQAEPGSISEEMCSYMYRYRDGSFSLPAITKYLKVLFGQDMLITDTQHPSYVLSDVYDDFDDDDKVQFFNPKVRETTVDLLTRCIAERMRIIREHQALTHVLSGVEVDILTPNGGLTVHNETLASLDYVTASFHSSIWYAAGQPDLTKTTCLDMYSYVVDNPNVDTISHPTFYIPKVERNTMQAQDWLELFKHMRAKQVAFEINLDSTDLVAREEGNLDRDLVQLALKEGVPLVIGFDFHYMADWGGDPSPQLLLTEIEAETLFRQHAENGSVDRLLGKVMDNIHQLKQLGLQPEDILNSTKDKFNDWLSLRES